MPSSFEWTLAASVNSLNKLRPTFVSGPNDANITGRIFRSTAGKGRYIVMSAWLYRTVAALRYVMYFRFLRMTPCLHIMAGKQTTRRKRIGLITVTQQAQHRFDTTAYIHKQHGPGGGVRYLRTLCLKLCLICHIAAFRIHWCASRRQEFPVGLTTECTTRQPWLISSQCCRWQVRPTLNTSLHGYTHSRRPRLYNCANTTTSERDPATTINNMHRKFIEVWTRGFDSRF